MNAILTCNECFGSNINECISCNYNNDGTFLKENTHECVIKCDNHWYSNLTDHKVNYLLNYLF